MKSLHQTINPKQKRIGFKRPVLFMMKNQSLNEEENSKDQDAYLTSEETENTDKILKFEDEKVDISKMKIPSTFESDQKLNISNSLFDTFDWIQTEPELFDFDQDIQIPDKFLMPF